MFTVGDGFLLLILALVFGCSLEEFVDAYRDRTDALLKINGVVEPVSVHAERRLWNWLKRRFKEKGGKKVE